ncbi:MAG: pirin family protein [Bacteroidetes bacterium]|nr:pirin family protein [Bacteroidota bacterium]
MTNTSKNSLIHKANTRGQANHGWLHTHHTFSFAGYHNPERVRFGVLRVLNDDTVAAGMGFGTHPHDNVEIITIPLSGALQHKDSMGNSSIIKAGEVQVMSAGSGITHSEFNPSTTEDVKLLQIWLFPNKKGVEPRYGQAAFNIGERKNKWQQIISPHADDAGLWIHQNAWFNLTSLENGKELNYSLHDKNNGLYVFVIEGVITINSTKLEPRDGMGLWDIEQITIKAEKKAEVLVMEVPMRQS